MDAKDLLMNSLVIEGHRDVYEQIYRKSIGEESPIRDGVAPPREVAREPRGNIAETPYLGKGDEFGADFENAQAQFSYIFP